MYLTYAEGTPAHAAEAFGSADNMTDLAQSLTLLAHRFPDASETTGVPPFWAHPTPAIGLLSESTILRVTSARTRGARRKAGRSTAAGFVVIHRQSNGRL